jgi:hypothetical protein
MPVAGLEIHDGKSRRALSICWAVFQFLTLSTAAIAVTLLSRCSSALLVKKRIFQDCLLERFPHSLYAKIADFYVVLCKTVSIF